MKCWECKREVGFFVKGNDEHYRCLDCEKKEQSK